MNRALDWRGSIPYISKTKSAVASSQFSAGPSTDRKSLDICGFFRFGGDGSAMQIPSSVSVIGCVPLSFFSWEELGYWVDLETTES